MLIFFSCLICGSLGGKIDLVYLFAIKDEMYHFVFGVSRRIIYNENLIDFSRVNGR